MYGHTEYILLIPKLRTPATIVIIQRTIWLSGSLLFLIFLCFAFAAVPVVWYHVLHQGDHQVIINFSFLLFSAAFKMLWIMILYAYIFFFFYIYNFNPFIASSFVGINSTVVNCVQSSSNKFL